MQKFSGQLASKQYISISAFYMTVSCFTTSPTRRRSCTPGSYSSFAVLVAFLALISGPLLGPNIVAAEGEELAHPAPTPTSRKGGELDAHDAAWAHSEQAYGRFWDFVAERKLVSACVRGGCGTGMSVCLSTPIVYTGYHTVSHSGGRVTPVDGNQ